MDHMESLFALRRPCVCVRDCWCFIARLSVEGRLDPGMQLSWPLPPLGGKFTSPPVLDAFQMSPIFDILRRLFFCKPPERLVGGGGGNGWLEWFQRQHSTLTSCSPALLWNALGMRCDVVDNIQDFLFFFFAFFLIQTVWLTLLFISLGNLN